MSPEAENSYQAAFFIVPARIMQLDGLTLNYLKVYETVFQFWNHGKSCFLSNKAIRERASIKAESTIRDAFVFFEKNGELVRKSVIENGKEKRYLIQPELKINVASQANNDKKTPNKVYSVHAEGEPLDRRGGAAESAGGEPLDRRHNINNINTKKDKRESSPNFSQTKCPKAPEELLSDEAIDLIHEKGFDQNKLLKSFSSNMTSRGVLRHDWQAAFLQWVVNERETKVATYTPQYKNEVRSTVQMWGPGHPTWESLNGKRAQ